MSTRLALLCLWVAGAGCTERLPQATPGRMRLVPGCASAVDYLTYLGVVEEIVALPQQALKYANGLSPQFVARTPRFAVFSAETILTHQPGLVLCDWYQVGDTTAALERHGTRVVPLGVVKAVEDIARNLERVGQAVGRRREAAAKAEALRAEAAGLAATWPVERPTVLPYFDHGTGARTAGRDTIEHLMIELAGGRNAAAELGMSGHGRIAVERVLVRPPRFFLTGDGGQVAALRASTALASLGAVREDRILALPSRHRNASSPYLLQAARSLRRMLEEHGVR